MRYVVISVDPDTELGTRKFLQTAFASEEEAREHAKTFEATNEWYFIAARADIAETVPNNKKGAKTHGV